MTSGGGVAVVLPGGGARGAYEAGALSALLPALEARGERVSIVCGTSVGAVNAALLTSLAHLEPGLLAAAMLERWRSMRKSDVVAPIIGPGIVTTIARLVAEGLGVPGVRPASLLDPAPFAASLNRWIDWDAVRRNLRARRVDALCAVATSLLDGVPIAFVDGVRPPPASPQGHGLRYARVRFTDEHVRASAALPLLFPPVEITRPRALAGYYLDGATRLNTPIKPALALGASRVIVVAFEPLDRPGARATPRRPRLTDVAANIVDGLLVDSVVDDIHRLAAINAFFSEAPASAVSAAARGYRSSRGREHYRRIPYALVAPARPGELGRLAAEVLRERHSGLNALRRPDFALLATVLGAERPSTADLLSFLLFDEHYVERLIAAGRADAERWLDRHPDLWCTDATHDLGIAPDVRHVEREHAAIEEFRAVRRR